MSRRITPPEIRRQMIDLYLRGESLADAASPFGLTVKAALNALKDAGIPRRKKSTPGRLRADLTSAPPFGRLKVIGPSTYRRGRTYWRCRCECGEFADVDAAKLRNGHTRSCGCLSRETTISTFTTHGGRRHPLYGTWFHIKQRCTNPHNAGYSRYGGRGIFVCNGIADSFPHFLSVVGERPSPVMSIDRIDNDSGYSCGDCDHCRESDWALNVRWATRVEQCRNRRVSANITYGGRRLHATEWAAETGIPYNVILQRLKNGWTVARTLTHPAKKRGVRRSGRVTTDAEKLRLIWRGMVQRCHNPECREFKWYGAKGVQVCPAWRESFDAFRDHIAPRPAGDYSVDRIDPCGNYEPGNVRWATRKEQAANKRPRTPTTPETPQRSG